MGQLKPLLLRINDTAALLSVGRTKVYQLIRAGTLPTIRLAGDMRVPRVAVERLVAEAMPKPAKEPERSITSEPTEEPVDVSKLSDEELARIVGEMTPSPTPAPAAMQRKPPPNRGGRPKGYPVSGAAKLAKERTQERREREQREREARWHPPRSHDFAIAWPAPTMPEEWDDDR
jgi:excisionase family DNA binding protein